MARGAGTTHWLRTCTLVTYELFTLVTYKLFPFVTYDQCALVSSNQSTLVTYNQYTLVTYILFTLVTRNLFTLVTHNLFPRQVPTTRWDDTAVSYERGNPVCRYHPLAGTTLPMFPDALFNYLSDCRSAPLT